MLETWLTFEKEANTESRHREIERKFKIAMLWSEQIQEPRQIRKNKTSSY